MKLTVGQWARKSRQGQVCGILGCRGLPIVKCDHCGNHYCQDHAFVIDTPAHPKRQDILEKVK
jgi:hypothetical protein